MYAVFLALGWLAARKVKAGLAEDLIVAGRAMPLWLATLTMTATWVDGGYLLGTAEGVYKSSLALGLQGGLCFGISLILGGLFFARRMRSFGFTTLVDPFEARFGRRWAAVLSVPAMAAEVFWSAELLVALGSTFGVLLGVDLTTAILVSAACRDRVHDGRRHVVGGLHRCAAARTGRRRPGRGAAVRARCGGRAGRRVAALRGRAGGSGRPAAAVSARMAASGRASRSSDGGTSA